MGWDRSMAGVGCPADISLMLYIINAQIPAVQTGSVQRRPSTLPRGLHPAAPSPQAARTGRHLVCSHELSRRFHTRQVTLSMKESYLAVEALEGRELQKPRPKKIRKELSITKASYRYIQMNAPVTTEPTTRGSLISLFSPNGGRGLSPSFSDSPRNHRQRTAS